MHPTQVQVLATASPTSGVDKGETMSPVTLFIALQIAACCKKLRRAPVFLKKNRLLRWKDRGFTSELLRYLYGAEATSQLQIPTRTIIV